MMAQPRRVTTTKAFARALERLRAICLAFPETSERPSHGMPSFFVRDTITFAMLANDHHGDGRADADRFFSPPYVGVRGWIGVRLEKPDWALVADAIDESYRRVAPRALVAVLDASKPTRPSQRGGAELRARRRRPMR